MFRAKSVTSVFIFILVLATLVNVAGVGAAPVSISAFPVTGTTTILHCSRQDEAKLITARNDASIAAANALAYFQSNTQDAQYTTWFGDYDSTRYSTVQSHFSEISRVLNTEPMVFDCNNPQVQCGRNDYAITVPDRPYEINLCSKFWHALATGVDSKAGILIHETSHFTGVAGTLDYAQGTINSEELALLDPATSIKNAANHEYFAENALSKLINVALFKPATQSSLFQDDFCIGIAAKAVDGKMDGNGQPDGDWTHCTVTHTQNDNRAWWQVNLKKPYPVRKIILWNRTDSNPERLSNFVVSVSKDKLSWQDIPYTNTVVRFVSFPIPGNIYGDIQYVKVQLQGTNFLSLAEVQVLALK